MSYPIATKSTIRYLGINLTKESKDLYTENYNTWMKETKKGTNKLERFHIYQLDGH